MGNEGMTTSVVVTGASGGIGTATVQKLLDRGVQVIATVRDEKACDLLSKKFAGSRILVVPMEIGKENAIESAAEKIGKMLGGLPLHGLVNNAGVALAGPLLDLSIEQIRRQFEINLFAPIQLTQLLEPFMRVKGPGIPRRRVVMVSSAAARIGAPFLGAYCSSKAALEMVSEVLRRELTLVGIDVVIVAPGIIATPIWDKAAELDLGEFADSDHAGRLASVQRHLVKAGRKGAAPNAVADVISNVIFAGTAKIRCAPADDDIWSKLRSLMPKKFVDRAMISYLRRLDAVPVGGARHLTE